MRGEATWVSGLPPVARLVLFMAPVAVAGMALALLVGLISGNDEGTTTPPFNNLMPTITANQAVAPATSVPQSPTPEATAVAATATVAPAVAAAAPTVRPTTAAPAAQAPASTQVPATATRPPAQPTTIGSVFLTATVLTSQLFGTPSTSVAVPGAFTPTPVVGGGTTNPNPNPTQATGGGSCHVGYVQPPCVPASGAVTCASLGNQPIKVNKQPNAPYDPLGLDKNGDGTACGQGE